MRWSIATTAALAPSRRSGWKTHSSGRAAVSVRIEANVRRLTAILLASGSLVAQTATPDVVIHTSVREVLLEVAFRDARGRLVRNVKPEDVTVRENGMRRPIRSFRLVAGKEVRSEDEQQAVEEKAATAPNRAPAAPRFNPLRMVNVVCLVLQDLDSDTRAFAFEAARKFVENELRPNTYIGVFALD